MFCANCGAPNKKDSKFCLNCGEPMSDAEVGEKLPRMKGLKKASHFKRLEFLKTFFGFSSSRKLGPKMAKFLYGLSLFFSGVLALSFIVVGFNTSFFLGMLALLLIAPLTFLLMVIFSRVLLETILLIFRVADRMDNMNLVNIEENPESRDGIRWNV